MNAQTCTSAVIKDICTQTHTIAHAHRQSTRDTMECFRENNEPPTEIGGFQFSLSLETD